MIDLSGVHLAVPTPFDPSGDTVDWDGFRRNLATWCAEPISGVLVSGSTGESVLLDGDERTGVVRAARDVCEAGQAVIAGAGGESTREAIMSVLAVAEAGADVALVSPPAFYRGAMTDGALITHYRAVAKASPVPVLIYQVPLRLSTIEFPTGVIAELSGVPNIAGVKDSRGSLDRAKELVRACEAGFQVLVGSGGILLDALRAGAVGGIVAVGAICPREAAGVAVAYRKGRAEEAERLQDIIGPVHDRVVGAMGVPGVKAALDLIGLVGGKTRPPLAPIGKAGLERLRGVLHEAGLSWVGGPSA